MRVEVVFLFLVVLLNDIIEISSFTPNFVRPNINGNNIGRNRRFGVLRESQTPSFLTLSTNVDFSINEGNNEILPRAEVVKNFVVDDLSNEVAFEKLRAILKGTCIYLVGMMGVGKSTIGNEIASSMGYRLLDTDEIAEFMIEMPISKYFEESADNINSFRDLEQKILMELAQYTRVVVSTGGGIVERNENWGFLRHGIVVHLDMNVNDIYTRLASIPGQIEKRPLLQGDQPLSKLQEIYEKRKDKYMSADIVVNISPHHNPKEATEIVVKEILRFIQVNPPLWETWKKKRDAEALEAAGYANPAATAATGQGFGEKKGSIQYVSIQDIQSGKVKLPQGTKLPPNVKLPTSKDLNIEKEKEEKPSKGFGKM